MCQLKDWTALGNNGYVRGLIRPMENDGESGQNGRVLAGQGAS